MSRVPESDDEQATEADGGQTMMARYDNLHFSHSNTMASWDSAFQQLYNLVKVYVRCTVGAFHESTYLPSHETSSLTCIGFLAANIGCIVHTIRLSVVS